MRVYFVIIDGRKEGPFTFEEAIKLRLKSETLVWHEGLTDWKPAVEIEELKNITSLSPPPNPKKKRIATEWFNVVIYHLLFASGLYYIEKYHSEERIKRRWIYPVCWFYAWFCFINIFAKFNPDMARIYNKELPAVLSIFIAWGIVYVIGFIDVIITFKKKTNVKKP